MKKLSDFLEKQNVSEDLLKVLKSALEGVKEISELMRFTVSEKAGSKNQFGEEQMALDVKSNDILVEQCKKNELIGLVASEELDGELKLSDGKYALCFDPLDGSSLLDVNLAVGTIIGFYETKTFIGRKGSEQVASLMATYGPRTTVLITLKKGVFELILNKENKFEVSREDIKVQEGKMFAPGNLKAAATNMNYAQLLMYWVKNSYKLRYSGGMVPDVAQILLKGKGIFVYPPDKEYPNGKLRLLVECAPLALLMQEAGGSASDGKINILDKEIEGVEERSPIYIGSKKEVENVNRYF